MTDVLTKKQRKYNMSRIKNKNSLIELNLRKYLWKNNIKGYRIHYNIYGKPDIFFTKSKLAVFIDGCFWHKCPKCYIKSETNSSFWNKKIKDNIKRDKKTDFELKKMHIKVIRFWGHEIKKNPNKCISTIRTSISNYEKSKE